MIVKVVIAPVVHVGGGEGGSTIVVDNLLSTSPTSALSAKQGNVLKALLDLAATQVYVQQQIALLVDSSPSALNTLKELATALGSDPNFATTVTDLIASKQPALGFTPENISNKALNLASPNDTKYPTVQAVATAIQEAIEAVGAGDMAKATYDTTNNGVVDDSEKLGGQLPSYYLSLANATGNIPAANVVESSTRTFLTTAERSDWNSRVTPGELASAIANLINGAPGAVDTLSELAAALGDDPNFATTITNLVAAKEALANKAINLVSPNDTKYPTTLAVSNALTEKANTSSLAAVALSGSYNDLTNTPAVYEGPSLPGDISAYPIGQLFLIN